MTRTVTARPGLRFGYTYKLFGRRAGAKVSLRFVGLFPARGLRNPQTGRTTHKDQVTAVNAMGERYVNLYTFEHDWEIVPGVWTFQIWYQGRKLAEQSFTVVKP